MVTQYTEDLLDSSDPQALLEALIQSGSPEPEPKQEPSTPSREPSPGWVVFIIQGDDLNPDALSSRLNMSPDRGQYADAREGRPGQWQLNSRLPGSDPLESHFWHLLRRLIPIHRKLWELSEQYRLEFHCTMRRDGEDETFLRLPPKLLLLTGYIGAGVEIETV